MSMRRWLAKNRPQADVRVIYNVRTPQDVIFADEWRNYPVTLVAENNVTEGFIAGRLTRELLAGVPDSFTYRDDLRPGSVYGLGRAGSESARRDAFL